MPRRFGLTALVVGAALVAGCVGPAGTSSAPPSATSTPASSIPDRTPPVTPSASPTDVVGPSPLPTPSPTPAPTATASPTATPSARPTPKPTPRPTATPEPTPKPTITPAAASKLITHGSRDRMQVALTFDMGGRVGDALAIMAFLEAHDVSATIFMTGAMVDNVYTDAGRQVLAMIDAEPGRLDFGNHSYHHPDFRDLTAAEMRAEIRDAEAAYASHSDVRPRPLFRPPMGGVNDAVLRAVGAAGYSRTIMWDVDTIDWRPVSQNGPTAAQISAKVLANARGGSIVLMHLGGYHTLDALPDILDGLRDAGYDLVTLGEMLGV